MPIVGARARVKVCDIHAAAFADCLIRARKRGRRTNIDFNCYSYYDPVELRIEALQAQRADPRCASAIASLLWVKTIQESAKRA